MVNYVLNSVTLTDDEFARELRGVMVQNEAVEAIFDHPRVIPIVERNLNYVLEYAIKMQYPELVDKILNYSELDASANGYKALVLAILGNWSELVTRLLERPEVHPSLEEVVSIIDDATVNEAAIALLENDKIVLDEESSEYLIMQFITLNLNLRYLMGIEKLVVNEDIVREVLHEAMRIRNARAIITLLYNDRTKGLISDEDRAAASRVPL